MAQVNLPNHPPSDPGEGGSFQVVPKGYYKAAVDEAKTRISKQGNNCINMKMKIVGGEYDGTMFFEELVFTPWNGEGKEPFNLMKARWLLQNAGVISTGVVDTDVLIVQLKGKRLTVKLDTEIYNEKERNTVVGTHPFNWQPEDRAGEVAAAGPGEPPVDLREDEDFFA